MGKHKKWFWISGLYDYKRVSVIIINSFAGEGAFMRPTYVNLRMWANALFCDTRESSLFAKLFALCSRFLPASLLGKCCYISILHDNASYLPLGPRYDSIKA